MQYYYKKIFICPFNIKFIINNIFIKNIKFTRSQNLLVQLKNYKENLILYYNKIVC